MPECSCEEENEVESDGDFGQYFLPLFLLPVLQQRQAQEEAGQCSSQVAGIPVCVDLIDDCHKNL